MIHQTWDITPTDADYTGPRITLEDCGGDVWIARADDPKADPWALLPVTMLQYIDQKCIRVNGDHDAARTFNSALGGAFPDGPPGGCGGFIDMDTASTITSTAFPTDVQPGEHHTCRNCGLKISPDMHPVGDRWPGSRWLHDIDGLTACPEGY